MANVTEDGLIKIDVTFDNETVWLSLYQMSTLFQRDKSTISRHIKNVFEEGELDRNSVVSNFATTEYKKYKARTLSDVENDYFEAIEGLKV